jgi:hypothetical protein
LVIGANGKIVLGSGSGSVGTDKVNVSDGVGGWKDTSITVTEGLPNDPIITLSGTSLIPKKLTINDNTLALTSGTTSLSINNGIAQIVSNVPIQHPDAVENNQSVALGQLKSISGLPSVPNAVIGADDAGTELK